MSRNKLLLTVVSMLMVAGAWRLSSNVEVGLTTDALAETSSGAMTAACTDPTIMAYVAGIGYTVTWAAASASAAALPGTATAALSSAVHSEANPTVTATLNATNATAGTILLSNVTPMMKLAGLQCQAISALTVTIYSNDGVTDSAGADFAIGNVGDDNDLWTAGDKIDAVAAAGPQDVFGATSPLVSSTLPTDGVGDTALNGEILTAVSEAGGQSEFKSMIDVTNYSPAPGTDTETFTFTLTGSAS